MISSLDFGIGNGLSLGGGSSPKVAGAGTASVSTAAYGAGATTTSRSTDGLFGTSPGHITIYSGGLALILLVLIRHSLPK